jgi:hypothetical protein
MRVRTAVAVVSGFVVAKAALTWLALEGWGSLPQRPGFIGHWRIQLGTFGEWFAALATAAAVGVALYIAWKDRHDRISERHDEQKTHARLVQLSVDGRANNRAAVTVEARNFGPLPVIDIDLVDATWSEHPEAQWRPLTSHWQARGLPANSTHRPILMPSQGVEDTFDTLAHFVICFMRVRDGPAHVAVGRCGPHRGNGLVLAMHHGVAADAGVDEGDRCCVGALPIVSADAGGPGLAG